jgi:hypothetical protein
MLLLLQTNLMAPDLVLEPQVSKSLLLLLVVKPKSLLLLLLLVVLVLTSFVSWSKSPRGLFHS